MQLIYILKTSNSSADFDTDANTKETCKQHYRTLSEERSDVVWIVAVTLLCVLIAICAIFHWIRKRKDLKVQYSEQFKKMNYLIQYKMCIKF